MKTFADIDLEKSALVAVVMGKENVDEFFQKARGEYFSSTLTHKIYSVMKNMYMRGVDISPIKLVNNTDKIDSDMLEELSKYDTLTSTLVEALDILHKYYVRRKLTKKAQEIYQLAEKEGHSAEEYQNRAEEIVFEAEPISTDGIYSLTESLEDLYIDLTSDKDDRFTKTGFPSLDAKIGGLVPGHLTVISAPTSMGKTAFALSVTYNLLKNGKKVIFLSMEMQHTEISQRLLVQDSKVPADRYRKKLKSHEVKNMDASLARLMDMNMYISDDRGLEASEIKARCRRIARTMEGVDLIVVDYLQNIKIEAESVNYAKAVGITVNSLRNLTAELNCPMLLLCQVNRGRNGIPKLRDLRDSGEIEENADEVWFPYRPEYDANKAKNNESKVEEAKLVLAKGRTVGTGSVDFVWYKDYLRWRDAYIDEVEGGI